MPAPPTEMSQGFRVTRSPGAPGAPGAPRVAGADQASRGRNAAVADFAGYDVSVCAGDKAVLECRVVRARRGMRRRFLRQLHVTIAVPAGRRVDEATLRGATLVLLRHFAGEGEGVWDTLTIRPAEHSNVIRLAACEFALAMDFGCDVPPASTGIEEVRLRTAGRRGALAHILNGLRVDMRLRTWFWTAYYATRQRVKAGVAAPPDAAAEIDMVLRLPVPESAVLPPPAGVRFEEVSPADVRNHPRRFASYGTDIEDRLLRGDRCFAGRFGSRVVLRTWICTDAGFIARRSPGLGRFSRAGYVYDTHTDPEWRGRSIRGASLHWVARHLSESLDFLVLSVRLTNFASIRAAAKAGFEVVAPADVPGVAHGPAAPGSGR